MTLRVRLMVLVLMAMLPAVAVIIDSAIEQHRHLRKHAEDSALTFARFAVTYHASRVAETKRLLDLIATMPEIHELKTPACDVLLKDFLFGNLNYANFGVIRPDGMVACSGVPIAAPLSLGDRDYFRTAVESRRLSVGNYQMGRLTNRPVQVIALPILNAERQVQAVVYAALNLDSLIRHVPLAELPPGSTITVVDRHGVILARAPDPQNQWTGFDLKSDTRIASAFIVKGLTASVTEAYGIDGVPRIFGMARLGSAAGPNGYVFVGIPSQGISEALSADLLPRIAYLGAAFLVIMLLAWFGSDALILKRTGILITATRKMGNGDFGARATINGNDEIACLAAEFNKLGDALQMEHRRLWRLNRIHEVLSGINGAILRIRVRDDLVSEACRIAVERGQLRFAWIGLIDAATGSIVSVASHGSGKSPVDDHGVAAHSHADRAPFPCTVAITEDRPIVYNDINAAKDHAPWRERALAYGFGAFAGFPIRRDGNVIGVMGLYAGEANYFEPAEVDLFEELAADISLGLEYIDKDRHIEHLLYHDALTGLPNRRLCEDRLQQAILRARHHDRFVGVVVINVTDFHRLVGVYGHHVADEILNMTAKHLLGHVREGDTVSRLEGDEFAVIYDDVASMQDAMHLARSLISGLPTALPRASGEIHLAIRGGVAIYPGDGESSANLLGNATLASNSGKESRTHSLNFYSAEIQQTASDREKLEQSLRQAIKDGAGLELYYQPIVDIVSRRIVSLEALARWNSSEFGSVPPSRFIPVAEETGQIIPLGEWVLDSANRQIDAWRQVGITEIRVAINISFHQLNSANFVERLAGIPHARMQNGQNQLAIELTESELMDNIETTIQKLDLLKRHDFTIYIDDFGTGYSSLSYLQKLPVDVLKIDQSFVSKLGQSESGDAIVRTIIALAKSLKLKTVAEGVETPSQLAMLQQLGCDCAQGYLFSKPKPAGEVTQMLLMGNLPIVELKSIA